MKKHAVLIAILVVISLMVVSVISCSNQSTPTTSSTTTAASTTSISKPVITLKLTLPHPPGNDVTVSVENLSKAILQRTNGQYNIEVHPGAALVNVEGTFDAVRQGSVNMASIGLGIFAGMDPGLAELPMSLNNVRANVAASQPFGQLISKEILEKKLNIKLLSCVTASGQEILATKPVKTLADWKGMLVGASNPGQVDLITQLGGAPVSMSWMDFYTALQRKTVDGVLNTMHSCLDFQLTDVAKYLTIFYGDPSFMGYIINLDDWNKMPADIQNIFTEEAQKVADDFNALQIKQYEELDPDAMLKAGVEIYYLPKAERDIWEAKYAPSLAKAYSDLGDFGAKEKAIVDKANADYPIK